MIRPGASPKRQVRTTPGAVEGGSHENPDGHGTEAALTADPTHETRWLDARVVASPEMLLKLDIRADEEDGDCRSL